MTNIKLNVNGRKDEWWTIQPSNIESIIDWWENVMMKIYDDENERIKLYEIVC